MSNFSALLSFALHTISTEQSEGETQTAPAVTANSQADITQQATTLTPTTKIINREKDPKRVAAGKKGAEKKTQMARQKQKELDEAYMEIKKYKAKATAAAHEPAPTTEVESPKNGGLSANQWIGIGGIVVGLLGIYYKREELKAALIKKKQPEPLAIVDQEPAIKPQRKGLRKMD